MKLKRTTIFIGVFLLTLSSCMVGPNFQKVSIESPENYRFATEPTDTVINLKWWELFQDKTLIALIDSALVNNKDVRIAASRIEESRIFLGYTKADMYPNFSYGANGAYGKGVTSVAAGTPATGSFSAMVNMNWELDFWGKYRRANEAARADMLASEYGLRTVQISIITDVSDAYYSLLDFHRRLLIAERTLESRKESTRIIGERFEKGTVAEIDLNMAQIQEEIAAAAIPRYERNIAFVENALRVLMGKNPKSLLLNSIKQDQIVPISIPVGLPSQLLERRPDILAAEQQVVAQNANIGVAQAMRFPSISLTGMFGLASADLAAFNANDALMGTVGLGLFGPIFNFGKNKRRVEIEQERTKQVKYNYEKVVLKAFMEMENALINVSTVNRELDAIVRELEAAKNAAVLSKLRYDGGVTSYLEVLESERQLFEIELYHSQMLQYKLSSYTNLYRVLGGGWIVKE